MNSDPRETIILWLSMPLASLIIIASCVGLFVQGTYAKETLNWTAQAIGQDAVDLFLISPLLVVTAILAAGKNRIGVLAWAGVVLYIIYIYTIYCFDVHFNNLFIVYCFTLGLAFYSFMYFLLSEMREAAVSFKSATPVRVVGVYLMAIACLFYGLWLSELLPAVIGNTTPNALLEVGLPTNPVHVIDLAVFLPGLFLVSLFVLKKKQLGLILAPVMLVFAILMNITIAVLIFVMKMNGIEASYAVATAMSVLALVSATLFILYLRNMIVHVTLLTTRDFPSTKT